MPRTEQHVDVDLHLIPQLERNLEHFARTGGPQESVDLFLSWFRREFGGRILETADSYMRFLTSLTKTDVPDVFSSAIKERYEMVRLRFYQEMARFPAVAAGLRELQERDLLDPRSAMRLERQEERERLKVIEKLAMDYLGMMSIVSLEALASALETIGKISEEERPLFTGAMGRFLNAGREGGGCNVGPGSFLHYEQLLEMPGIREYAIRVLKRVAYLYLQEQGIDDLEDRPSLFRHIDTQVESALYALARKAGIRDPRKHDGLFAEVIDFFKDIEHLSRVEIPQLGCFVEELEDYSGDMRPFPSMRQLMSVRELFPRDAAEEEEIPKQYTAFQPGDGKSPVGYITWKLRQQRRRATGLPDEQLLHLLPTHTAGDIANQIRELPEIGHAARRFFVPGYEPSLGFIHSSIPSDERELLFTAALQQEVIICPVTMLNSHLGDHTLIDHIESMPGMYVIVDEAQDLCSGGGVFTKLIRRILLVANVRNMYSGTPAGHGLAGANVALQSLEDPVADPSQASIDTVPEDKIYRPEVRESIPDFRARLRRLHMPDQPRNYDGKWHYQPLRAEEGDAEPAIERIIVNSQSGFWEKYYRCLLGDRNPALFLPGAHSKMLERMREIVEEHLAETGVIIFVEEVLAEGVFKRHPEFPEEPTVSELLEQIVQEAGGEMDVIYGDIQEARRNGIKQRMRRAKERGERFVLFANAKCIRTGLDLTSSGLIVRIGPSFRRDNMVQEFCRADRAGHDARMIILYRNGSIEEVKLDIMRGNYEQEVRCLSGDNITTEQLEALMKSERDMIEHGRLAAALESMDQRLDRFSHDLHSAGTKGMAAFWLAHQADWRKLFVDDVDRSGAEPANMQRFLAAYIEHLERDEIIGDGPIMQIGTSGLSLSRHLPPNPDRRLIHLEPLQSMLDYAASPLAANPDVAMPERIEGSALKLRRLMNDGTIERGSLGCVVIENFHQYSVAERMHILLSARQAAKSIALPLPYDALKPQEFGQLSRLMRTFGWDVVPGYSGDIRSLPNRADEQEPPQRGYVLMAVARGNRAPTKRGIASQLGVNPLQFTHQTRWNKRRREELRHERTARHLPYSLIRRQFQVGRELTVSYDRGLPAQNEQLDHLDELRDAVRLIRNAAPDRDSWRAMTREAREALLEGSGIVALGGVQSPGFILESHPTYGFHPYESKWERMA